MYASFPICDFPLETYIPIRNLSVSFSLSTVFWEPFAHEFAMKLCKSILSANELQINFIAKTLDPHFIVQRTSQLWFKKQFFLTRVCTPDRLLRRMNVYEPFTDYVFILVRSTELTSWNLIIVRRQNAAALSHWSFATKFGLGLCN